VQGYYGDLTAEEVAGAAGGFIGGYAGYQGGYVTGKGLFPEGAPGSSYNSSSGTQSAGPRVRHHTSPKDLSNIRNNQYIKQSRGGGAYVEGEPFGPTSGPNGPKQTFASAEEGAYVEFDSPAGAIPDPQAAPNSLKIPLKSGENLSLTNLNPQYCQVSLLENCINYCKAFISPEK